MQIHQKDLVNTPIFEALLAERPEVRHFLTSYKPVVTPRATWPSAPASAMSGGWFSGIEVDDEGEVVALRPSIPLRLKVDTA